MQSYNARYRHRIIAITEKGEKFLRDNGRYGLDNPNDSTQVYRWMLSKVQDANGNYIKYNYNKDSGQVYPSSIVYTGNGSTDGPFQVSFLRTSRTDVATSSKTGFYVVDKSLINEIDTSVSGTWVHKYVLGYGTGSNGRRSLVTSVTESGQQEDGSASLTLPSETFAYTASTSGWTASSWTMPGNSNAYFINGTADNGSRLLDINGDGLPDITYYKHDGITNPHGSCYGHSNATAGWDHPTCSSITFPQPVITGPPYIENGVRWADVNGDGRVEILQATNTYINDGSSNVFESTASSTWALPAATNNGTGGDNGSRFFDMNADGLVDEVSSSNVWFNTGKGWLVGSSAWTPPARIVYDNDLSDAGSRLCDLNGDGLIDEINYQEGSTSVAFLNTGNGWVQDNAFAPPQPFTDNGHNDLGSRMIDVNGDGLCDEVRNDYNSTDGTTTVAYINNGHGFTRDDSWKPPVQITNTNADQGVRIDDVDANGLPDFVQNASSTAATVYLNKSQRVDLLSQITTSKGATTSINYQTSHQYLNGNYTQSPNLPIPVMVVASTTVSDGFGNTIKTNYTYAGGLYYFGSPADRKFAGFSSITQTDPDTGYTTRTYYDQGTTTASAPGKSNDDEARIGKPYRIEQYANSSSTPLDIVINTWGSSPLSNNREFVYLSQSLHERFAGDGTSAHRDTADTYSFSTSTGNMNGHVFWGEVTGNDDGTFADVGTDEASTTITYAASSTSAVFAGLPQRETTVDDASSTVSDTRHCYDNQSLGTVIAGNETKTETWKSGTSFASTTKAYNGTYGLVATSTDGDNHSTTYSYDLNNLYPATTTNALGQTTVQTYDYSSGQVKNTTDSNNRLFQTLYDPLDRIATSSIPDPTSGSLVTKATYSYTDSKTPGSSSVHETDYQNSASSTSIYTYTDSLGRPIQTRTTAQGTNTYAVKDFTFNNVGLPASESLPYFASSTPRSTATSTSALFTNYAYDPFNRLATTTNAVGSTTNTYTNAWRLTVADPLSNKKAYVKDAYDNLVNVVEYNSGPATTTYAFDLKSNLATITDALGNIRVFTYDGMNRRLTSQDLHASSDGTYGTTTYTYDDAGNLTQKVDPIGQTVNYTYDSLNRPLTEDYTGNAGTEITYAYDTCANGKGRFCSATTTYNGITDASFKFYNPLGLVATDTKYINGTFYSTGFYYDRLSNQTDVLYPDNSEAFYTRDGSGQVTTVQQRQSGGAWRTLASGITYSPLNQEQTILWGSGATTTNTYDPNNLYRLTHKVTLLPDSGDWGTGATGNAMGFITVPFAHAASSSGSTPPKVSTNLNSDSLWLSNSTAYNDTFEYGANNWNFFQGHSTSTGSVDCTVAFSGGCSYKVAVTSSIHTYEPDIDQIFRTDPNVNYTL
jgi:YD repeat-containing protein